MSPDPLLASMMLALDAVFPVDTRESLEFPALQGAHHGKTSSAIESTGLTESVSLGRGDTEAVSGLAASTSLGDFDATDEQETEAAGQERLRTEAQCRQSDVRTGVLRQLAHGSPDADDSSSSIGAVSTAEQRTGLNLIYLLAESAVECDQAHGDGRGRQPNSELQRDAAFSSQLARVL